MANDAERISNLLQEQRDLAADEEQHMFIEFEDYWERKLWHELTQVLVDFFKRPESEKHRIPLFDVFIKSFAAKINQLKLVQLGLATVSQREEEGALDFLTALAKSVNKPASQDAYVDATVAVADAMLKEQDVESAREKLDEAERILDTFDSVENSVYASFYRVSAEYYKRRNEFASYYKNALLYLACVDLADLDLDERRARAYHLSIAALVSDSIYNFGELLLHPILDALNNTAHAWLRSLLFAFNQGDLAAFEKLAPNMDKVSILKENKHFLYEKISLSALTEAVFRRPPHDRTMTFDTIQKETKVQVDEIEHLIMRALSLGLLRGTIDQVSQVARINWVQPKVLDMAQIESMRGRLREWDNSVNSLGHWIEGVGKDVWAA